MVAAQVGEGRFALAGHSMGAHTAVAYALAIPERRRRPGRGRPGLRRASSSDESLAYWDGLAEALESGGVDGFVDYIDRVQGIDPRWRDSVLRFTRERMLGPPPPGGAGRSPAGGAALAALRLAGGAGGARVPALVVASGDDADPGHPYAIAAEYAQALPLAQLISEGEGESPLAWQGGRLSRAIAELLRRSLDLPPR